MIEYMQNLLQHDGTKVLFILSLLMGLIIIDTVLGVLIAKFDPKIKFSSFKMKMGILLKIVEVLLCILAVPFALLFDMGLGLVYVLYMGLCASEVYSILGHMKLVDDNDKGIDVLETFFGQLFKGGKRK